MSAIKPTNLDRLLAAFSTHRSVEQLDEELYTAASHHHRAEASNSPNVAIRDEPLIEFDPVACRVWLLDGAATEAGIDDGFRSENMTVTAGIEELLALLNHDTTQHAWRPTPPLHDVRIWRTGDGDGIDGGGLLTVDLDYPGGRVCLGSLHQGFDDFIRDSATCGIDAAVEALGHVAAVVNRTYATFLTATATATAVETDGHTTGGDQQVYGLVEWDGSYRPTVIVGCCRPAVLRDIVAIITGWAADGGQLGSDEFQQQHPIPDPNTPAEVLADWLHALRIDTAVPYVTLMDPADLVHTGDPLIIINRLAANPCYSRPVVVPPDTDRFLAPAPSGPPVLVNGYPVVSAVAEDEHAASWIVICRLAGRMPDWANGSNWYVTWRAWWAHGRWNGENGDYGPHHGLTWPQAQQSLLSRLRVPALKPAADPGVYLQFDDHTDTWNCPACRQPIAEVYDCTTLGALLEAVAAHRCASAAGAPAGEPQPTPSA